MGLYMMVGMSSIFKMLTPEEETEMPIGSAFPILLWIPADFSLIVFGRMAGVREHPRLDGPFIAPERSSANGL